MLHKTRKIKKGPIPDRCIFLKLTGGLGNQLFLYAVGLIAQKKLGLPLYIIHGDNGGHTDKDYTNILFKRGIKINPDHYKDRINSSKQLIQGVHQPFGLWSSKDIHLKSGDGVIGGKGDFYQNYRGIKPAIPLIRKDIVEILNSMYSSRISVTNKDALMNIKDQDYHKLKVLANSAFIHIRRGDYSQYSIILPDSYYKDGLNMLNNNPHIKHIYVISNDVKWCKEQEWLQGDKHIIIPTEDELGTLYVMSQCTEGAVLSASTFSLWGVFLGADSNSRSTITYPSCWFSAIVSNTKLSFPSKWKRIYVKPY